MATQAVGFERQLQILYAVFCLSPLGVVIVEVVWPLGLVGHQKAGVGAFFHHLRFVDNPPLSIPAESLVVPFGKQLDLSLVCFVAFLGLLKQGGCQLFEARVGDEGYCVVDAFGEIWLEVVDLRFLGARGVPSQEGNKEIRRWRAGGKDTPLCSHYTKMNRPVDSSCSTSTRSPEPERGGCSPRRSKPRSKPISIRQAASETSMDTPWSFAMGAPGSVRTSAERELWR